MEFVRPPIHIGPVLEGEMTEEFKYLRQKAEDLGIGTIIASRGGGALLQRTVGFLPQLFEEGVLGTEPWAMFGTSTGAISTVLARSIGFADIQAWHASMESVAAFDGVREPWNKLTKPDKDNIAHLKLNFLEYYNRYIKTSIEEGHPDEEAYGAHKKPALCGVVVTRKQGKQPYIYHDEHWQDEDGAFSLAKMVKSVEGSCALPVFAPMHDDHIGAVIDGGVNNYDLHTPISVAERVLEGRNGRIISIEPASSLYKGIHIEQKKGITVVRIAMEHQKGAIQTARNIFVFDSQGYELGRRWGSYAADVIRQISH